MIRFSVVTITFNAEKVLQRTLDSVMSQTYAGVEHLIIDGASTDGTLAMAEKYKRASDNAANGHEVIVASEPDKGIYDAMNKGLKRATGNYIVFMNAGDFFPDAETLSDIAAGCRLNDTEEGLLPGVLYGNTNIVDDEGRFLRPRRLQPPQHLTWRSFRNGMLVCHQAFYARTDIARSTPYDMRYRFSADVDWCIRVMKETERRGLTLQNINKVVANYTEQGATTRNHRKSLGERFDVMRRHYGLLTTCAMHAWFILKKKR